MFINADLKRIRRDLYHVTKKYSYSPAQIKIGDDVISEQILYDVTQRTNQSGTVKELDFFSKTGLNFIRFFRKIDQFFENGFVLFPCNRFHN